MTSGYESRYELKRSANTWTRSPVAVTNKMLSFELGKEIKERYFSSCHERRTKKKNLSPHEESDLRPLDSALRCSTTEPQSIPYFPVPSERRRIMELYNLSNQLKH